MACTDQEVMTPPTDAGSRPYRRAVVRVRDNLTGSYSVGALSLAGARLTGPLDLREGEYIKLLLIDGEQPVSVIAEVDRVDGEEVQVVFRDVQEIERALLERAVKEWS